MISVGPMLAILVAAQASLADGPSIDLQPLHQRHPLEQSRHYSSRCGTAVVRVLGVTQEYAGLFKVDFDAGRVIVRKRGAPDVVIDSQNGLSDHNGIACIEQDGRTLILVWSDCGGSACGHGYNFTIVDTETPRILAPRPPERWCDSKCAAKWAGELPARVDRDHR